jgi:hypothetical protein
MLMGHGVAEYMMQCFVSGSPVVGFAFWQLLFWNLPCLSRTSQELEMLFLRVYTG